MLICRRFDFADVFKDFLENSTIHGLVYISTAKSFVAKSLWVIIVALGFGSAVYLIANSYAEWIESPVSTVVSTRPISDLEFPEVTVCPPKESNTALNYTPAFMFGVQNKVV